jgi:hypothetical protein
MTLDEVAVRRGVGQPASIDVPQHYLAVLARELRATPGRGELWMAVGALYRNMGENSKGERALRRAVDLLPDDPLARALLGRHLLELGELAEGSALYCDRRRIGGVDLPLRYHPKLLWDGDVQPGRSVLLWGWEDLDEGFPFVRLAALLNGQGMRVGLDVPDLPLEIVRQSWPEWDPTRQDGQFDAHYPLSDLIRLWRSPNPTSLNQVVLPLAPRAQFGAKGGVIIGIAADAAIHSITAIALQSVATEIGARALTLSSTTRWGLHGDNRPRAEQASSLLNAVASVDAVLTTSALYAHIAASASKPVVYVAPASRAWCWARGRSAWYPKCTVLPWTTASPTSVLRQIPAALSSLLDA